MAAFRGSMIGLVILGGGLTVFGADAKEKETVELRDSAQVGDSTKVLVTLKAEGLYRPAPAPGAAKSEPVKPLKLKVETRLEFLERVLVTDPVGKPGRATRVVRKVSQAASAINGEIRPTAAVLRPEVALLVAEPRAGGVVVFSPGGPLTRSELELVQGAGDPLALASLLTDKRVKVGDSWTVGDDAARSLSSYDSLIDNALQAKVESIDAQTIKIHLEGNVRGSVLGGEGKMLFEGTLNLDRAAGRIDRLHLQRSEARKPGAVEAGLEVKSTLTVTRQPVEPSASIPDDALAGGAAEPDPQQEQLLLISPDGKYTLSHDRNWHTYWDDRRLTVLKRLDRGVVVAQCNLLNGPNAGKGRHQDLKQFRNDLRSALGSRFASFLGEGEVEGDPAGGFRYKVGVQGREGNLGLVWYYYLIASPDGDQLLATFTQADNQVKAFGDQDLRLIGSLRWRDAAESSPRPDPDAKPE
ncbi:hypothetical protein [Singulisphaera acidiphila]|uniref:Uncharacterized protein n=1 Tax=Singulisphaera acidiphila (strain ATCC BAA-1392 / DSM 18658 / VKM B-2454 / MOB10) TaxID=886293 RepID=L0D8J6_SINAD|nr:hypothetical protein [Singulisphaera acidiphila]AGA24946.1 hypothetical protein Sinac_0516 [Singulisphaera acidiphila DSM 18658]